MMRYPGFFFAFCVSVAAIRCMHEGSLEAPIGVRIRGAQAHPISDSTTTLHPGTALPPCAGNTILFSLLDNVNGGRHLVIILVVSILSVTMTTSAVDSLQNAIVDNVSGAPPPPPPPPPRTCLKTSPGQTLLPMYLC